LSVAGWVSLFTASSLNSGMNCAAISAAIGVGEQAEPDRKRRYTAALTASIFYVIVGIFAKVALSIFQKSPAEFIAMLTCVALLPALANSTYESLRDLDFRVAAIVTFLVTTSGIHVLHIGAPFWGLCAGLILQKLIQTLRKK